MRHKTMTGSWSFFSFFLKKTDQKKYRYDKIKKLNSAKRKGKIKTKSQTKKK